MTQLNKPIRIDRLAVRGAIHTGVYRTLATPAPCSWLSSLYLLLSFLAGVGVGSLMVVNQ